MNNKKQSIHYAWLILVSCCMMQGACLGLINNCSGVFFTPVCEELGFEMGDFTFYRTLFMLSQAFTMPFVAKFLRKWNIRLLISAMAVVMGGVHVLMGTFTELWQFYLFGMIQGASTSFIGLIPAPILLGNWFYKKTGTAVGISSAFSGLAGMVGSSVLGMVIPAFGWRTGYMVIGITSIVMILPFSLFVLHLKPEVTGMRPYGTDETYGKVGETVTEKKNRAEFLDFARQPIFYVCVVAYACAAISSYLNSFITSCGLEAGFTLTSAAMLTSLALFGNMTTKLFLGKFSDSHGVMKSYFLAIFVAEIGHCLLFLGNPTLMPAGACLYGITMPLGSVLPPLLCRLFWDGEDYGSGYSFVTMFGILISAPFTSIFGTMYDMTGSYHLTIFSSGVSIFIILLMILLANVSLKKGLVKKNK